MAESIDQLYIEIEATAKGTSAVFKQLENQLATVQKALNGLNISKINQVQKALNSGLSMSKAEKDISSSVDSIKQNIAGLGAYMNAALNGDTSSATSFNRKAVAIQSDIDKLKEKFTQLGNTLIPTEAFSKLKEDEEKATAKLDELKEKLNDALSSKTVSSDTVRQLTDDVDKAKSVLDEISKKQEGLIASGKAYTDPFGGYRDSVKQAEEALKSMINYLNQVMGFKVDGGVSEKLSQIGEGAKSAATKLAQLSGKGISNALSNIKTGLGKIGNALSKIKDKASAAANHGFGKILKYVFGIRSMYVLFRRLRKAVVESFGELQKSGAFFETTRANVEGLKASLTTLKFQFGAVFEPIFNAVAPALQTFIDYLVTAMNVLSAFMAKLMGKSTYSKAVANMGALAKNTGSAAKAQKELNKQLQGFDELNNLTTNDGSGGGSGAGGGGSAAGANYVEESIDSVLGDFGKDLADKIREGDWKGVGTAISEKLTEVLQSIKWDEIIRKAGDIGHNIAEFLNGLITPELFTEVGNAIGQAINTALTFFNEWGKGMDWLNIGNSLAAGFDAWVKAGNLSLLGETLYNWISGALTAATTFFTESDFEELGSQIGEFLGNLKIPDLAGKLEKLARSILNALGDALKSLWNDSSVTGKIGLAIVGIIAAAKLTGASAALSAALTSYFGVNPIVIAVATAIITFESAKWTFEGIAESLGNEDLASAYRDFSWSDFFGTIEAPDGSGIDWAAIKQGWEDMCYDYFEPLFETIDGWKDDIKEKFVSFWTSEDSLNFSDMVMEGVVYGPLMPIAEVARLLGLPSWSDFWKGWFSGDGGASGGGGSAPQIDCKINTKFTGAITKLKDFTNLSTKISDLKKNAKTISSEFKSKMSGLFNKPADIDGLKEKFNDFTSSWKDRLATIKANVGGQLSKIGDLDTWKSKFKGLFDSWNSKDSKFTTSVGGQISKISDLNSWKTSIADLRDKWFGKDSTFSSKVGGQLSKIVDLDTWKTKMSNLRSNWLSKDSVLSAKLGGGISNIGTLDTWKSKMSSLQSSWVGRTATFVLNQTGTAISTLKDKIQEIVGFWKDKTATFKLAFTTTVSDIKSWINNNIINPLNSKIHSVYLLRNVNIPTLKAQGGVTNKATNTIWGESGAEALIPLEHNLKGVRMIAATMLKGMADVSQYRYSASPSSYGFSGGISSYNGGSESALMAEQNRLLAEQNQLLRQIAAKDVSISSGAVFNAVQNESNSYYNRTGNSPFVF